MKNMVIIIIIIIIISVMELGHLLTRSGLTYPEVSSNVYHDSFCPSGSSVVQLFSYVNSHTMNRISSIQLNFLYGAE